MNWLKDMVLILLECTELFVGPPELDSEWDDRELMEYTVLLIKYEINSGQ